MRQRVVWAVSALALVAAACGPGEANVGIVVSSPGTIGVGDQRVLVALLDEDGNPLARPDLAVEAVVLREGEEVSRAPTEFIWSVDDVRGLYAAHLTFERGGNYQMRLEPDGMPPTPISPFPVIDTVIVPEVGSPAIPSRTRTAEDVGGDLTQISTDPDPDPSFYRLSLRDAFTNGRPTVVVFATPAFCQTAACGPALDRVKQIAPSHPDADFVHVEIYSNLDSESVDELQLDPSIVLWGFPSEPWVYVVNDQGTITARFEGTASTDEVEAALNAIGA